MGFSSHRVTYRGLKDGYQMNPTEMDAAREHFAVAAKNVITAINSYESEINGAADNIEGDSYDQMKATTAEFKRKIENFQGFSNEMGEVTDERKAASLAHDQAYAGKLNPTGSSSSIGTSASSSMQNLIRK